MLSAFSSKASISDGMGVHKCIRYGQLACFGCTVDAPLDAKVSHGPFPGLCPAGGMTSRSQFEQLSL